MTVGPTQPLPPAPGPAGPGEHPSVTPTPPATLAPPVAPVGVVGPRPRSGGVINLLLIGAACLAIGGVAFAIGRSTAPAGAFPGVGNMPGGPIVRSDGTFAPGDGPRGVIGQGSLAIEGTVTAIDADSITLTLENGAEQTFALDGSTTYREAAEATAADVAVGDDVSVQLDGQGRIQSGGADPSSTPELTAGVITVSR